MMYPDDELENNQQPGLGNANAYRVDDDDNVNDESLERFYTDKEEVHPVREGQPMGGHNFGENNVTRSGNDVNNPQENSGTSNAYLSRNEPSEEHAESPNFKADEDYEYNEGTTDNDKPTE